MEPFATAVLLALVGTLLITAGAASTVSRLLGVPALLVFLALGMAAGSEGLGGIPFADYSLGFRIGVAALVLILFDGGLNTSPAVFRSVAWQGAALATVGVVLTAGIVAGLGLLLGLSLPLALLVGSVVSSTDAAAVFSILRTSQIRLQEKTGAVLEVESGLNDPMAVLLTFLTTEALVGRGYGILGTVGLLAQQFALGALGGALVGYGGRFLLQRVRLPVAGLYPVVTVGLAFIAFGMPTVVHGSGFLAVYIAAMILGAGPLPYRAGVRRFHDSLAWLAQTLMFLMLGLLVFPSRLWPLLPAGIALALGIAFVARPLATAITLYPFDFTSRQRRFICWVGLRGAVPIILAMYPALRGVPGGDAIFHLVFFVVVVNSLLPGATVTWVARRMGLARETASDSPASVELIALRDYAGEFVWYGMHPASAACGACVQDLPLPAGCVLTIVLRDDEVLAPRGLTQLRSGDHLCFFVTRESRHLLQLVFGRAEGEL